MKARKCGPATIAGRLRKARQFMDAAETVREFADDEADSGDAFVTLCVLAGIAAADVLCCVSLGEHAQGDDHSEALALLKRVQPDGATFAKDLGALLRVKTKAGYAARAVNPDDRKRAHRSAARLVAAARDQAPSA